MDTEQSNNKDRRRAWNLAIELLDRDLPATLEIQTIRHPRLSEHSLSASTDLEGFLHFAEGLYPYTTGNSVIGDDHLRASSTRLTHQLENLEASLSRNGQAIYRIGQTLDSTALASLREYEPKETPVPIAAEINLVTAKLGSVFSTLRIQQISLFHRRAENGGTDCPLMGTVLYSVGKPESDSSHLPLMM